MTDAQEDLWGSQISAEPLATPVSILREQANLLGTKTDNLLRAEVVTSSDHVGNFEHSFYIVVPLLDNYRYRLFSISHGIQLYPVVFYGFPETLNSELHPAHSFIPIPPIKFDVSNEVEFKQYLKEILSAKETLKIVKSLIGQIS